jgi:hypothetical protein
MSIYYNPTLVKLLMEERIREAREANRIHCCEEIAAVEPRRSLLDLFRRQSPAPCSC